MSFFGSNHIFTSPHQGFGSIPNENISKTVPIVNIAKKRPVASFSECFKYQLIDNQIHFSFESLRKLILPAKELSENSEYFEKYIQLKTENSKLLTEEIINLVDLKWNTISEQHLLTFFCWIGSKDTDLTMFNDLGIIIFSVLGKYFQLVKEKSEILIEMLNSVKLEDNFEFISPFWQSYYLSFEYFSSVILGYIKREPVSKSQAKLQQMAANRQNGNIPNSTISFQGIDFILLWIDKEAINQYEIPELDENFRKVKKLITDHYRDILPTNKSSLLSIMNKYSFASRLIDSKIILEVLIYLQ